MAIVLEVASVFLHCAKAYRRGGVWQPETWSAPADTLACEMFNDTSGTDMPPVEMRQWLEQGYEESLKAEQVSSA